MTSRGRSSRSRSGSQALTLAWLPEPLVLASWVLGFAPVLYLALQGGGYDAVVRNQVGIAVWWIVLIGAAIGVLPRRRMGWAAFAGLGVLALLVVWTLIGTSWTESREATVDDAAKVAVYGGVFVLALAMQGKASINHVLNGIAVAIGVVALLAVLYRVHQQWFDVSTIDATFETNARRLSYPLNYWNGLAAFLAIGLPLVARAAIGARTLVAQAIAAATVPVMTLAVFFTVSRGGVAFVLVAAVVFVVLLPRRLTALPTLALMAAGSAILIVAADGQTALKDGLRTALARSEGDDLLALIVVTCLGIALAQAGYGLALRHVTVPGWLRPSRRVTALAAGGALVVAIVIALAAGAPGKIDDEWQQFKSPGAGVVNERNSAFSRLDSLSGNGRYQYWQSADRAHASDPLKGIGSGTFEAWWARDPARSGGFVRDAHSLYAETWGELGWIGTLLIGGGMIALLAMGVWRAVRARSEQHRLGIAAATAGVAAFATAAAVEWIWEIAVIPVVLFLLAAVILGRDPGAKLRRNSRQIPARVGLAVLSVAAVVLIAIPLASTKDVRDSQSLVTQGDLSLAYEKAADAAAVQPYSATALMQQALVAETAGDLSGAQQLAEKATRAEPMNWRTWLIASRVSARRGQAKRSVAEFRHARSLNPDSPLFRQRVKEN